MSTKAARIARAFHKAYEALAPEHGETREAARPWDEVPQQNRELMIATIQRLLDECRILEHPWGRRYGGADYDADPTKVARGL